MDVQLIDNAKNGHIINPMKPFKRLTVCISLIFMLLNAPAWADESETFHFFFQGVYKDRVTLNRVQQLFHDFPSHINLPVQFNSKANLDQLEQAITTHSADLVMWGYSDDLSDLLHKEGYRQLLSSPVDIKLYQYSHASKKATTPLQVAVLADSTALYSAQHFYQGKRPSVELVIFNNYFSIVQACMRKEVDVVISAKPFLAMQPDTIAKRFKVIQTLPEHAKFSIWVKSNMHKDQQNMISEYFIQREPLLKEALDTQEFKKHF